jgi:CBS domain-containing protein
MAEAPCAEAGLRRLAGSVGEAMTPDVPVIACDTRADLAARRLEAAQASGALVTDQTGRMVGLVTLGDLLRPFGRGVVGPAVSGPWRCHEQELSAFHVDELMDEAEPVTIRVGSPLLTAVELMDVAKADWLAVVDHDGRPLGLLTRGKLANVLDGRRRQAVVTG